MTPEDLEALRDLVRRELRAVGLRPTLPAGTGAWRWDAAADQWRPVAGPDAAPEAG